jgi:hypothetical protein
MNKLEANSPIFTLSPLSYAEVHTGQRSLIVLVPEAETDIAGMARKVWELANALGSRVEFLGLCKDETHEPALRRQMIALSTMVEDGRLSVEWKIGYGSNWLDLVKANWQTGDVIACFAEQHVGFSKRPLGQILESKLGAVVYVLSGFYRTDDQHLAWLSNAIMWAGSLGIIGGFLWMQSWLVQLPHDWAHTSLLYVSVFIEIGIIVFWNSLF